MQNLLLLHGAIGAADQLAPLAEKLSDNYKVHTLNFSGHGGREGNKPFSIELFVADVLTFMEDRQLDTVSIFGYSMGGYVGMYLAKHHPGKVDKIVTLATKYEWDNTIAAKETQMLNPEKIELKLPAFAQALKDRHQPGNWKDLLHKTAAMMTAMGANSPLKTEDYSSIAIPALILLGDKDKMVGLDETIAVYRTLPNAQMGMLPATAHPIEQVNIELLSGMVKMFLR